MSKAFGPREPEWLTAQRDAYHARRLRIARLEVRIGMSEGGLRWLGRVKALFR